MIFTFGGSCSRIALEYGLLRQIANPDSPYDSPMIVQQDGEKVLITGVHSGPREIKKAVKGYLTMSNLFIGVGFVGALREDISAGRMILPDKASDDFNGRRGNYYPGLSINDRMNKLLGQIDSEPIYGSVYSIDCIRRETPELVRRLQREGYLGIDMESSEFLSQTRGKRSFIILVVSENITRDPIFNSDSDTCDGNRNRSLRLDNGTRIRMKQILDVAIHIAMGGNSKER